MFMFQLEATVSYQNINYNVSESDGPVKHVLVLSKPLPTDVTITVTTTSGDTAGELYMMLSS